MSYVLYVQILSTQYPTQIQWTHENNKWNTVTVSIKPIFIDNGSNEYIYNHFLFYCFSFNSIFIIIKLILKLILYIDQKDETGKLIAM